MKSIKKVETKIITGIIGSGKTSFINEYLDMKEEEYLFIVQFEDGHTKINSKYESIIVKEEDHLKIKEKLEFLIKEKNIEKLIIEWNSMKDIFNLIKILDDLKIINIESIVSVIDNKKFPIFYKNYRQLVEIPIIMSDLVIINEKNVELKKNIERINERASIYYKEEFKDKKEYSKKYIKTKIQYFGIRIIAIIIALFFIYNILFLGGNLDNEDIDKIKSVLAVSMGIVLEAIPFVLIGVILSSLMQNFIREEKILKIIPKNKIVGIVSALIMGFIFPVCDCGVVPITASFIRKKIPNYIAIIFMLSSPIMNPTVIFSTYYAFKDIYPGIVILRILLGIIVSIIVGIIISIIFRNKSVLKDELNYLDSIVNCNCEFCSVYNEKRGLKSFLTHIIDEFISVSKYLILGSIIAAIFQIVLPLELIYSFSTKDIIAIIVMIIFSYLISLCSTSDSFVSKSFFLKMPTISIIGFLVTGAMIDIKNTLVLSCFFNRKFIITLITLIILVSISTLLLIDKFFVFY